MASSNHDHILLFSNQHIDLLSAVHDLNLRARSNDQLRTFLASGCEVVRNEINCLNSPEAVRIGEFEDLLDLAQQSVGHPVVDVALLIATQIGQLLV